MPSGVAVPAIPCPPPAPGTSNDCQPFSPSLVATETPLPPFEYATAAPPSAGTMAVRQVSQPPASAIESTDQASPFGVASCTLAAEDVDVVNAIHGSPPTTAIEGPNPGVSVTCDTVACVVV